MRSSMQSQCNWVSIGSELDGVITSSLICLGRTCLAMTQPSRSFCLGARHMTHSHQSPTCTGAPEAVYFICSKQVCTLADIVGACRIALQQGRFTFGHYAVLQVLVSSIKCFWHRTRFLTLNFCIWYLSKLVLGYQKLPKKATADCYIVHHTGFFCLTLGLC